MQHLQGQVSDDTQQLGMIGPHLQGEVSYDTQQVGGGIDGYSKTGSKMFVTHQYR